MRFYCHAFHIYAIFRGIALGLYMPVYLIFLNEHQCPVFHIGLLGTFFETSKFIVELPSGRFTDLYGPKLPLIFSGLIGGILWLILFFSHHTLYVYYLCTALLGVSEALISGSIESWMAIKVPKNQITTVLLNNMRIMTLFSVVAGMVSGVLYQKSALCCFVLISLANFLKALIPLWSMNTHIKADRMNVSLWNVLSIGIRYVWGKNTLRTIIFSIFFVTMACDMVLRYYELYLHVHGFTNAYTGYVFGIAAFLAWLGLSLAIRYERWIHHFPLWMIVGIDLLGAITCYLLIVGSMPSVLLTSLVILLSLEDMRAPIVKTLLVEELYAFKHKALVFSLFALVESLGEILAGILFGYIVEIHGLHTGFFVGILLFVLSAGLCIIGHYKRTILAK